MDEWRRFQLFRSMLPPLEELSHVPREKLTQALERMYESMGILQENMRRFRENPEGTGGGKIYGMTQSETQTTLDQLLGEILIYQEILEADPPGIQESAEFDRSPIGNKEISQEQLMNYYRTGSFEPPARTPVHIEMYVYADCKHILDEKSFRDKLPLARRMRILTTPTNLEKQYPQAKKFYDWISYNSGAGFSDIYLYYELSTTKRILQFTIKPAAMHSHSNNLGNTYQSIAQKLAEDYIAWSKIGQLPCIVELYYAQKDMVRFILRDLLKNNKN